MAYAHLHASRHEESVQGNCENFPLKVAKYSLQMPLYVLSRWKVEELGYQVRICHCSVIPPIQQTSEVSVSEVSTQREVLVTALCGPGDLKESHFGPQQSWALVITVSFWLQFRSLSFFESLRTKISTYLHCYSGKEMFPRLFMKKKQELIGQYHFLGAHSVSDKLKGLSPGAIHQCWGLMNFSQIIMWSGGRGTTTTAPTQASLHPATNWRIIKVARVNILHLKIISLMGRIPSFFLLGDAVARSWSQLHSDREWKVLYFLPAALMKGNI